MPNLGEWVMAFFLMQKVTIATVHTINAPFILALWAYNSDTSLVTPILYKWTMINILNTK